MATETEPNTTGWYFDTRASRWLRVADVDLDDELVVVRYQDGHEDEFSLDRWYALDLEPGEPPEGQAAQGVSQGGLGSVEPHDPRRDQSGWARHSRDDIYPE